MKNEESSPSGSASATCRWTKPLAIGVAIVALIVAVLLWLLPRPPSTPVIAEPKQQAALKTTPIKPNEIRLRCTIIEIVPLSGFKGTLIPVSFNARYGLSVRIESAEPSLAGFVAGSVATFGIHSPAQMFGGPSPEKGEIRDLTLQFGEVEGKRKFTALKVDEPLNR